MDGLRENALTELCRLACKKGPLITSNTRDFHFHPRTKALGAQFRTTRTINSGIKGLLSYNQKDSPVTKALHNEAILVSDIHVGNTQKLTSAAQNAQQLRPPNGQIIKLKRKSLSVNTAKARAGIRSKHQSHNFTRVSKCHQPHLKGKRHKP